MPVDDEQLVREVTANLLKTMSHRVLQASNKIAALTLASPDIDLVLTDFAIPEKIDKVAHRAYGRHRAPDAIGDLGADSVNFRCERRPL